MDRLRDIWVFESGLPLIFTQLNFWIFFTAVYAGYCLVYRTLSLRSLYLMAVSLFFYYKTAGLFVFILLFSTVNEYFVGHWMDTARSLWKKRALLVYTLTVNLGILAWFKYAYFFTESYNHMFGTEHEVVNVFAYWANGFFDREYFRVDQILLPAGISFYTFQSVSYALDVYRGHIKPIRNIIDFGFFVCFFPQLVAGPIVRASEFIPQIRKPYSLTQEQFGFAGFIILKGLVKKIAVGDYLAVNFIDRVMQEPLHFSGFENTMAMVAYSLQVYCDFSGYTDVATGVALLMGFHLPQNFNSPYKAQNVGDFWKRWHMTLSRFLKDYLYIPLGGNRRGSAGSYLCMTVILVFTVLMTKMYFLFFVFALVSLLLYFLSQRFPAVKKIVNTDINLMVTMVIGGLWHGASINFLLWGGLNGLGLVVYKYWKRISPYRDRSGRLITAWRIFFTFAFITFTRIFFRAADFEKAKQVIRQILLDFHGSLAWEVLLAYKTVFLILAAGYILHWIPASWKGRLQHWFAQQPLPVKSAIAAAAGFMLYQSSSSEFVPFIYFQF